MTTTFSPLTSPLPHSLLTSASFSLRSPALSLQTSVYDGLHDGSYKSAVAPLSVSLSPSPIPRRTLTRDEIIQEYEANKMFDDSKLEKLRIKAVKRYNSALLRKKLMVPAGLASENRKTLNGEYVFTKLEICELKLAMIDQVLDLKQKYGVIIERTKAYLNPYQIESEKEMSKHLLMMASEDFEDALRKLYYLSEESNRLLYSLERQKSSSRKKLRNLLSFKWVFNRHNGS